MPQYNDLDQKLLLYATINQSNYHIKVTTIDSFVNLELKLEPCIVVLYNDSSFSDSILVVFIFCYLVV